MKNLPTQTGDLGGKPTISAKTLAIPWWNAGNTDENPPNLVGNRGWKPCLLVNEKPPNPVGDLRRKTI